MKSIKEIINGKSVIAVSTWDESTREGINKAYIPKFLYKPPYGYPRYVNMSYIRWLAKTPYVEMCISTIIDAIASIEWKIVPVEGMEDQVDEAEKEHIRSFLLNPNTNNESFEEVFIRMPVRDILEVNSGILNKIYNFKGELVEVVARDGSTFTKNPDVHGMITNRLEIILPKEIVESPAEVTNPFMQTPMPVIREAAAYFQYGWIAGPIPIPFGKKEIIWLEKMKRTDDHYGFSPVQQLAETLQMLIYMIKSDLEYYNNNNVPKGIIGLENIDPIELKDFKAQWFEQQNIKDEFGQDRKLIHKVPFVNKKPFFERIEFSAQEMQVIEKQKWYTKMVWAMFGVTPVELGYTDDAKGQGNQIVQSKVFRKKAVNPIIRMLEDKINKEIITEFGYIGFLKTITGKSIEMQKYKINFNMFDVDEEKSKFELYDLQIKSRVKAPNEIRVQEGLEEKEGGDELAPAQSKQQFNFGNSMNNNEPVDPNERAEQIRKNSNKIPGSEDPNDTVKKTEKKLKAKKYEEKEDDEEEKKYTPTKAQTQSNPLILKEGEKPTSSKRLERSITYVLKQQQKVLNDMLDDNLRENVIKNLKGFSDLILKLGDLINLDGLKTITSAIIGNNFLSGWDQAEVQLNRNISPDQASIDFIEKYTFENIKGMNDDLVNKLRQTLKRSYMNGDSLSSTKSQIAKIFNVSENRAEAIARTETNRAANVGKLHAFKKSGVTMLKQWVTHFDGRTSDLCSRLDGQTVTLEENFEDPKGEFIGQSPPSHVNCRSTMIFIQDDSSEQKSRNPTDIAIQNEIKNQAFDIEKLKDNFKQKAVDDFGVLQGVVEQKINAEAQLLKSDFKKKIESDIDNLKFAFDEKAAEKKRILKEKALNLTIKKRESRLLQQKGELLDKLDEDLE